MIKLRLRRMGAKRQPHFRIVAADSRSPRDGRFIEVIGYYNPKTDPLTLKVDNERARYWLANGAQPTDTVRSLLVRSGAIPAGQGTGQPPGARTPAANGATAAAEEPATEAVE